MASESSRDDILTEEELLGDHDDIHLDDLDEHALLDDEPQANISIEPKENLPDKEIKEEKHKDNDSHHEHEELDYGDDDEIEDEQESRSKFTSELKPSQSVIHTSTSASTSSVLSASSTASPGKNSRKKHQQNLPSLLRMNVKPPPVLPGGKILVNPNFVPPSQPQVRLTIPGIPTITMPPPMPMQPFMPRMAPGFPQPFMPLPSNHGIAGFGQPYMNPQIMVADGWNNRVAAFLTNVGKRRRRRSSSYSSSGSSSKSNSRSRSRSSSRSRRRRSSGNRRDGRRNSDRRRDRSRDRRDDKRNDRYSKTRKNDGHRSRNEKAVAEECAKAVGVDSDYLSKVEEQKKKREELVRQKEQRRFGGADSKDKAPEDTRKKAYLCVTIKNIAHLEAAPERIEKLANEIGTVTKCWQFSDDQVNLIFKDHSFAKGFLLKYNNKVITGVRLQISLEKAFLNLSEIKQ